MKDDLAPALLDRVAERFRALGDPTRLRILMRLRQGAADVGTLADDCVVAQASVSKHLGQLRQVGLVLGRRDGARVVYQVCDPSLDTLCDTVCAGVQAYIRSQHDAVNQPAMNQPAAKRRRTR